MKRSTATATATAFAGGSSSGGEKSRRRTGKSMDWINGDTLCIIFSFLDFFDLVRCSAVCKSWNMVINRSRLLHALYTKKVIADASYSLIDMGRPLNAVLEDMAMRRHRSSLINGSVHVNQWIGHTSGVEQCRMKMGLILTGVGDKVMRLWSAESCKCLEEYSLSDLPPLVDFDFDESKVVGLTGTRICIWRRHGNRSIFPSREGTFPKGLCMRYMDPEAAVGCEDGTVRVFDMYSKSCSRIIRMHSAPVTCLALGEDQLILSGSSLGSVTLYGPTSDQRVAVLRASDRTGIKTLCYNPSSQLVFTGSTAGYAACWDLRKMKSLWEKRVSPNVVYSIQCLSNDPSTLVVGGIDGVVRILDQNSGEVLSSCVMDERKAKLTRTKSLFGLVERKEVNRLPCDANISDIPLTARPPIKCLAVGMEKVVTTHNSKYIRIWKFTSKTRN
ncbi:F-box/WD-40 repeat-containing protein At3g52030 [Silene latifolia]|uniref:F-box/WD-40 repeat-containing protein At3g52030 n=1 Tax=Silene latifolia TaxID=37657 RepID=UPI003D7744C3